jgi:hypothetical protein
MTTDHQEAGAAGIKAYQALGEESLGQGNK